MLTVIHPHLHRRRTGVTQHVVSVVRALAEAGLPTQVIESRLTGLVLPPDLPRATLGQVWLRARRSPVIWHAHRNNEVLLGWILRVLGAGGLRLVWTRHASHRPTLPTRWMQKLADRTVALTPQIAQVLGGVDAIVPHGIDLRRFTPPEDRDSAWNALEIGGRYGVGVIGRVREAKGQGVFREAWAAVESQCPQWNAVLVGGARGDDVPWASALKAPRLTWVGEKSDPVSWYRGLSILVQPSFAEGLSLAFLEGLASGCCVVATRVSDFPALIEDGRTGFLFDPGDHRALADILKRLTADPALVRSVGMAAAEVARARFGVEHEARALAAVYASAVSAGSKSPVMSISPTESRSPTSSRSNGEGA